MVDVLIEFIMCYVKVKSSQVEAGSNIAQNHSPRPHRKSRKSYLVIICPT